MTQMDFRDILPLDQFKSESKEFLGYFYVESVYRDGLPHICGF